MTGQRPNDHSGAGAKGRLFIVSAPSGAGKTTLCNALRRRFADLAYSVSYTTRPPRRGEKQGEDYFFISRDEFEQGIAAHRWAEWAQVHDHLYGTSAGWMADTLSQGGDILMDIDLQGARQMLRHFPNAITIFIRPPSLAVLAQRLRERGTDDEATIALRLENAKAEMAGASLSRHVVVNDAFDQALDELIQLVLDYRSS